MKQKGLDEKLWSDNFHLHYVFGVFYNLQQYLYAFMYPYIFTVFVSDG